MPLDTIPLPSVWDVPVAAGVPALLGQSIGAGISASASTALGGVIQNWAINQEARKWGVYDSSNKSVLSAARVYGVEYESGYAISDAPLEDGAFTSYNKVKAPYNARILMICDGSESAANGILSEIKNLIGVDVSDGGGGSLSVRQAFLTTLESIVADTNLYSVVTPERTYANANIVGYRWRRSVESGITMMGVEIALQEVRLTASASYINAKNPSGQETVQNCTVQPAETSPAVIQAVQDAIAKGAS